MFIRIKQQPVGMSLHGRSVDSGRVAGNRLASTLLLLLLLLLALPAARAATEFTGRIVSIADGDTLTVLRGRQRVKVRLVEIDAPERGQPFGGRSTESLRMLCADGTARVVVTGEDQYQRTLGRVWCGGVDINVEQVRRGMAWVYDQYVMDRGLYAVQAAARADGEGLWAEPAPVPPWMWRRGMRSVAGSGVETRAAGGKPVIANRRSGVYHLPTGCPGYDKVSAHNRVVFESQEAARAAGYRIAGNCR